MPRFLIASVLGLAAAATLSCAAPAGAQATDIDSGVPVTYGDLDLGSQAGAQVLLKRIEAAATAACGGKPDTRELSKTVNFKACRRSAIDKAVAAVDSPVLTAMARGGAPDSFAAR